MKHVKNMRTIILIDVAVSTRIDLPSAVDIFIDLPLLDSLDVSEVFGTDDDIAALARLSTLKQLAIEGMFDGTSTLTDNGLQHLTKLKGLRSLSIQNHQLITDAGISALSTLRLLESFDMSSCTRITNESLSSVARMSQLRKLVLRNSESISAPGICHLKVLPHLVHLDLHACMEVDDQCMEHVSGIVTLQWLDISWCELVTVNGLEFLGKNLQSLHTLALDDCNMNDAEVADHIIPATRFKALTFLRFHSNFETSNRLKTKPNLKLECGTSPGEEQNDDDDRGCMRTHVII